MKVPRSDSGKKSLLLKTCRRRPAHRRRGVKPQPKKPCSTNKPISPAARRCTPNCPAASCCYRATTNLRPTIRAIRSDSGRTARSCIFSGEPAPGWLRLLDLDSGEDVLFGDDPTLEDIIWTGPQPSLAELAGRSRRRKNTVGRPPAEADRSGRRQRPPHPLPAAVSRRNPFDDEPTARHPRRPAGVLRFGGIGARRRRVARGKRACGDRRDRTGLRDRRQNAPPGDAHVPSGDYRTRNRRGDRRRRPATRSRSIVPVDRNAARRNAA